MQKRVSMIKNERYTSVAFLLSKRKRRSFFISSVSEAAAWKTQKSLSVVHLCTSEQERRRQDLFSLLSLCRRTCYGKIIKKKGFLQKKKMAKRVREEDPVVRIGSRNLRDELGPDDAVHMQRSFMAHSQTSDELKFFPRSISDHVLAFLDFTENNRKAFVFPLNKPGKWMLKSLDHARFLVWKEDEMQCWNLADLTATIFAGTFLHLQEEFVSSGKVQRVLCTTNDQKNLYFVPKTNTWEEASLTSAKRAKGTRILSQRTKNTVWVERDNVKSEALPCQDSSFICTKVLTESHIITLQIDMKLVTCQFLPTGLFTPWEELVANEDLVDWWRSTSLLCWTTSRQTVLLDLHNHQKLWEMNVMAVFCRLYESPNSAVILLANGFEHEIAPPCPTQARRWHPKLQPDDCVCVFFDNAASCVSLSNKGHCFFWDAFCEKQIHSPQKISANWTFTVCLDNHCLIVLTSDASLEVLI